MLVTAEPHGCFAIAAPSPPQFALQTPVMPKVKRHNSSSATGPIADKSKGQHFLKNPLVVKGIVDRAAVLPTDTVSTISSVLIVCKLSLPWLPCVREQLQSSPVVCGENYGHAAGA